MWGFSGKVSRRLARDARLAAEEEEEEAAVLLELEFEVELVPVVLVVDGDLLDEWW